MAPACNCSNQETEKGKLEVWELPSLPTSKTKPNRKQDYVMNVPLPDNLMCGQDFPTSTDTVARNGWEIWFLFLAVKGTATNKWSVIKSSRKSRREKSPCGHWCAEAGWQSGWKAPHVVAGSVPDLGHSHSGYRAEPWVSVGQGIWVTQDAHGPAFWT